MEQYLLEHATKPVGPLKISKVSQVSGEMSRVTVRGKPKLGYSIKMHVEVEKGSKFITIMFEDFNDYSDHEVNSLYLVSICYRNSTKR